MIPASEVPLSSASSAVESQSLALQSPLDRLTDPRRLGRNVVVNLLGWVLPAATALVTLPMLALRLGPDRFGVVALAWGVVGWFSLFDFGIARALTRLVAARHAAQRDDEVPSLVWSASALLLALSVFMAAALFIAAPLVARRALHLDAVLLPEVTRALRWLALGIPAVVHATALRGVLEARQQFRTATALRAPLGVATYALPLLAHDAATAVALIVAARAVYWLASWAALGPLARPVRPTAVRELWTYGGWITLSSVISPLLVQGDRFALALLLPIAASGWYATASEVATKLWLFTAALQPVFFSAVSAALSIDPQRARALMRQAAAVTFAALLLPTLALVFFAEPGMRWWMNGAYSAEGARALPWLATAVFVNCIAQVPYSFLQAGRGARAVALLHLAELPLFAVALVLLVPRYGVSGAAAAWCLRMTLDAAAMWGLSVRSD